MRYRGASASAARHDLSARSHRHSGTTPPATAMKHLKPALALAAVALPALSAAFLSSATPPAAAPVLPPALLHCQVPCGIYGDTMRIDAMMEDVDTIEKGMGQIVQLEADGPANQLVRWVLTKDEHAAKIQEQVASYWLAQRVKAPREGDEKGRERYLRQLEILHGITVAAMKCKQTTDVAHTARIRELALAFSKTYFKDEDLKHLEAHHGNHEEGGR